MAFGANKSPIVRSIKLYPCVSGSSLLAEYRGSGFDVVALDFIAILGTPTALQDMKLAALAGVLLSTISNYLFTTNIGEVGVQEVTVIRYADINGIAHVVVPTAGLVGGDRVLVSATVIG